MDQRKDPHSYDLTAELIARSTAGPTADPTAGPTANESHSISNGLSTVLSTKHHIVSPTTVSPTKTTITPHTPTPTIIEEGDSIVVLKEVGFTDISLQKMKPFELYSSNKPGTRHHLE